MGMLEMSILHLLKKNWWLDYRQICIYLLYLALQSVLMLIIPLFFLLSNVT